MVIFLKTDRDLRIRGNRRKNGKVQRERTTTAGSEVQGSAYELVTKLKRCLSLNGSEQIVARPHTQFPDSTLAEQLDSFT